MFSHSLTRGYDNGDVARNPRYKIENQRQWLRANCEAILFLLNSLLLYKFKSFKGCLLSVVLVNLRSLSKLTIANELHRRTSLINSRWKCDICLLRSESTREKVENGNAHTQTQLIERTKDFVLHDNWVGGGKSGQQKDINFLYNNREVVQIITIIRG